MRRQGPVDLSVFSRRDLLAYGSKSVTSADVTLTDLEMQPGTIEFTGALTADRIVNFPLVADNQGQTWRLKNSTSAPFKLTVKVTSQTGFVLERGELVNAVCSSTPDLIRSDANKIPRRYELKWVAGQHGKPGLNTLLTNSVANYAITDRDFEVLGTNMTSALCTYNAEGGIKLTTAGADNDQGILVPHLLTNGSPWTAITWGTDQETEWEAHLKSGSSIASTILWAGLKLTNTPTAATDNDSVYVRYQNAVNSGKWQALYSINNVDTAVDAGITVAADTEYHVKIKIDASRIARVSINGLVVATSTALTDATDFIPYVGVMASGAAAAKSLLVFGQAISRKYA